jgi:hypothetical protein
MATLTIDEKIVARLNQIAEQEKRSIDDVLNAALDNYQPAPAPANESWIARLAKAVQEEDHDIEWAEGAETLSTRSREILQNDFADYLLSRMERDAKHTS